MLSSLSNPASSLYASILSTSSSSQTRPSHSGSVLAAAAPGDSIYICTEEQQDQFIAMATEMKFIFNARHHALPTLAKLHSTLQGYRTQ